jgi:hypothetical protein
MDACGCTELVNVVVPAMQKNRRKLQPEEIIVS